jgi:hypothetical protein
LESLNGRPRFRWKEGLTKFEWGMVWIHLAKDREEWQAAANTVLELRVAYRMENFLKS